MFRALILVLPLMMAFASLGYAADPITPAKVTSTDTCNGVPNNGFSALDIDADGVLNPNRDAALLFALINGSLDTVSPGAIDTVRKIFPSKSGIRREYEVYFRNTLLNLGLDVNADRKVDVKDSQIIYLYLSNEEMGGSGVPDSAFQKAAGSGFKVNFEQLKKLKNTKLVCNGGKALFFADSFGFQPAAHYSVGWGGEGLVWVYSSSVKAWMYIDRSGDMYQWDGKSNPAVGKLITKGIDPYYSAHPEVLVNLRK